MSIFLNYLILTFFIRASNVFAVEADYEIINHNGKLTKQWKITNKKYYDLSLNKESIGEVNLQENNTKEDVSFKMNLNYSITSLNSIDKKNSSSGKVISNKNLGLSVLWGFKRDLLEFNLESTLNTFSVKQGKNEILNTDHNLIGAKLIALYGNEYKMGIFTSYKEHPFLTIANTQFSIDVVPLFSTGILLSKSQGKCGKWCMNYNLFLEFVGSGKSDYITANSGIKYGSEIEFERKFKKLNFVMGLGFDYKKQDTEDTQQNQLNVISRFGVVFDF